MDRLLEMLGVMLFLEVDVGEFLEKLFLVEEKNQILILDLEFMLVEII